MENLYGKSAADQGGGGTWSILSCVRYARGGEGDGEGERSSHCIRPNSKPGPPTSIFLCQDDERPPPRPTALWPTTSASPGSPLLCPSSSPTLGSKRHAVAPSRAEPRSGGDARGVGCCTAAAAAAAAGGAPPVVLRRPGGGGGGVGARPFLVDGCRGRCGSSVDRRGLVCDDRGSGRGSGRGESHAACTRRGRGVVTAQGDVAEVTGKAGRGCRAGARRKLMAVGGRRARARQAIRRTYSHGGAAAPLRAVAPPRPPPSRAAAAAAASAVGGAARAGHTTPDPPPHQPLGQQ
eukprot:276792-Chlamydomonas_euryale.AAC.4